MSRQSNGKTHIFLPVEIKVREFYGKLLLALVATEAGYKVVLGGQKELRQQLPDFPPGIYVDKSVAVSKNRWFERFRRLGNTIVAWDEEGLVIHEDQYIKSRFSKQAFDQVDLFFAWGPAQRDILVRENPERKDAILLSGNPRFDMLRPEIRGFYSEAAEQLKKEHGPIILVNTNFGFYNHFKGVSEARRIFMKSSSHGSGKFIDDWIDFQKQLFEAFVEIIPWLSSQFQDHSIIIRPHPSEGDKEWQRVVSKLSNVKVLKKGNVLEWIVASDAVIHSNCTTGIEAYLLGVPSIAYRPILSDIYETYLPNSVRKSLFSLEKLQETMLDIVEGKNADKYTHDKTAKAVADKYISHIDGVLASDFIVDNFALVQAQSDQGATASAVRLFQSCVEKTRTAKDNLQSVLPSYKHADSYDKEKFPGIDLEEIQEVIRTFQNVTSRFAGVHVTKLGKSCFILENK